MSGPAGRSSKSISSGITSSYPGKPIPLHCSGIICSVSFMHLLPVAAGVVDAVLIPEVPFTIKGDHGLFKYLEGVLEKKGHCVVCVAEGAGQVRTSLGLLQDVLASHVQGRHDSSITAVKMMRDDVCRARIRWCNIL